VSTFAVLAQFCPLADGGGTIHWDLLIEIPSRADDPALAAWQLPPPPNDFNLRAPLAVRRLPDHRRIYLTYEGDISAGRGRCHHIDGGPCHIVHADDAFWHVQFAGQQLTGTYQLRKTPPDPTWMLAKDPAWRYTG